MSAVYHTQLPLFFKVCKHCHPPTEKPIEEFDRDRSKPDGRATMCKDCSHARHRERWARLHPPKEKPALPPEQAAIRQRRLMKMRQYHQDHIESIRSRKRAYQEANREHINAKQNAKYQQSINEYRASLPQVPNGYKKCAICHVEKPIGEFYKDKSTLDGHRYSCKECADRTDRRKSNPGKRRNKPQVQPGNKWCYGCKAEKSFSDFRMDVTKRDGRAARCRSCSNDRARVYWRNNRERYRIYRRNYYERHIEKERMRQREKNKNPRARLLFMSIMSRRNAQKFATQVEEVDFRRIIQRDGYHCYICNQAINPDLKDGPARLVFDHVVPLGRNGTHTEDNIKPTHRVCNERKNVRPLKEMTPHQRRGPDA